MDNATSHCAKSTKSFASQNGLDFWKHPAYLPDFAPSDFYLFCTIKQYLKGKEFESEDEIFDTIVKILNGISKDELLFVMVEWKRRPEACISNGGEYID